MHHMDLFTFMTTGALSGAIAFVLSSLPWR